MIAGIATLSLEQMHGAARRGAGPHACSSAVLREFLLGPENALLRHGIGCLESQPVPLEFRCNPLLVHGPTGCGKSQFLEGLATTWSQQHPSQHVLVTTAVDFARSYATAVKLDDVLRFQQRFQRVDLLLLDAVDALESKQAAQQQLAAIIDHRVRIQRPLLLTAQQPLAALKLCPYLVSRLAGGLSVPLLPPSADTKREMLRRLALQRPLRLVPEAEQFLVEQSSLTLAAWWGILRRLVAISQQDTATAAQSIELAHVRALLGETDGPPVDPKTIIRATAKHLGLQVRNLTGASRRKLDVLARSVAMYLIRELTRESFQEIGRHFGDRDHTTVMHAYRKIQLAQQSDAAIRAATTQLQRRLASNRLPLPATNGDTTGSPPCS